MQLQSPPPPNSPLGCLDKPCAVLLSTEPHYRCDNNIVIQTDRSHHLETLILNYQFIEDGAITILVFCLSKSLYSKEQRRKIVEY